MSTADGVRVRGEVGKVGMEYCFASTRVKGKGERGLKEGEGVREEENLQ